MCVKLVLKTIITEGQTRCVKLRSTVNVEFKFGFYIKLETYKFQISLTKNVKSIYSITISTGQNITVFYT